MRSNFMQHYYGFTTFGESHGKALGIVIEDVKSNLDFPYEKLDAFLEERRPGKHKHTTSRQEKDRYQILSGVLNGKTLGTPICIIFPNVDAKSKDYATLKNIFRPSHADFSYFSKFKIYDHRGGGRSSGRETIARVAASSFVDALLTSITIDIETIQVGIVRSERTVKKAKNHFHWRGDTEKLETYLTDIAQEKDTVGGVLSVSISGINSGIGSPVLEKLEANLAKGILSIGSIKGISFGAGFQFGKMLGSEANDAWVDGSYISNYNGGIIGGISTGQNIEFQIVVKPTPSIGKTQYARTVQNETTQIKIKGRHDVCIIPRVIPVIKAMIKLVLSDEIAHQKLISDEPVPLLDYREALEKVDEDILIAIRRRNEIAKQIGKYKQKNNLSITDKNRESEYLTLLRKKAKSLEIDKKTVEKIWELLFEESKRNQK